MIKWALLTNESFINKQNEINKVTITILDPDPYVSEKTDPDPK
jgi:hypothetical protein